LTLILNAGVGIVYRENRNRQMPENYPVPIREGIVRVKKKHACTGSRGVLQMLREFVGP